jgi:predicted transcriptional regulator
MSVTTTLKLPDALKSRIAPLAQAEGKTAHAWMVSALELQATLSEKRAGFIADALAAEQEALQSGSVYAAEEAHRHLRERAAGKSPTPPQTIRR